MILTFAKGLERGFEKQVKSWVERTSHEYATEIHGVTLRVCEVTKDWFGHRIEITVLFPPDLAGFKSVHNGSHARNARTACMKDIEMKVASVFRSSSGLSPGKTAPKAAGAEPAVSRVQVEEDILKPHIATAEKEWEEYSTGAWEYTAFYHDQKPVLIRRSAISIIPFPDLMRKIGKELKEIPPEDASWEERVRSSLNTKNDSFYQTALRVHDDASRLLQDKSWGWCWNSCLHSYDLRFQWRKDRGIQSIVHWNKVGIFSKSLGSLFATSLMFDTVTDVVKDSPQTAKSLNFFEKRMMISLGKTANFCLERMLPSCSIGDFLEESKGFYEERSVYDEAISFLDFYEKSGLQKSDSECFQLWKEWLQTERVRKSLSLLLPADSEKDPVLNRYRCAFTGRCVRVPVCSSEAPTIFFERDLFQAWCEIYEKKFKQAIGQVKFPNERGDFVDRNPEKFSLDIAKSDQIELRCLLLRAKEYKETISCMDLGAKIGGLYIGLPLGTLMGLASLLGESSAATRIIGGSVCLVAPISCATIVGSALGEVAGIFKNY